MKIQCNVCETAEATVLCCADEAALCDACDQKVHAANKLASKHQRVSLSHSSSHMPKCDICQEQVGYFFCLEDRALLCRKCDISIHTVNSFVSGHQRFLLTGVKVGLEAAEPGSSSSGANTQSSEKGSDADNRAAPAKTTMPTSTMTPHYESQNGNGMTSHSYKRSIPMSTDEYAKIQPVVQNGTLEDLTQSRMSFAGGSFPGNLSQWPIDDFLISDFNQNYGFTDNGSSKADSGKLGSTDSSSLLRSWEDELDSDERLGQVPDVSWSVPKIPSPPTSSGLFWPKTAQHLADTSVFVPDLSWSEQPNYHQYQQPNHNSRKQRRRS